MTADDFYMKVGCDTVNISVKDCGMKAEAEIYVNDFVYALLNTNDNFDMLAEYVKKDLVKRAENAWDESMITDDNLAKFKKVLEMIL